ncbi:MAG: ABC transporter permease [Candidatus Diapherotrites archaeon]|nr:ABC transporter permease [Candidatus Diapherotrites archaeon]
MRGVYTIWLRETLRFVRNKSRLVGSMGMPLFFLLFMGTGIGSVIGDSAGGGYTQFMAPGVLGMMLLFGSVFSGLNVVFDKQFGFMKEMLVAPISREAIVLGKALGGATAAMLQAVILLALVYAFGVLEFNVVSLALLIPVMFLISVGFVCVGVAFASKLDDPHGFQLIMNFLIMPLFFLSTAFFPLDNLPPWLKTLSLLDPLTYGVDAMRSILVGQAAFPLWVDVAVLAGFSTLAVLVGARLFKDMKL